MLTFPNAVQCSSGSFQAAATANALLLLLTRQRAMAVRPTYDRLSEELICPVCLRTLEDAVIMPECSHSLCRECVRCLLVYARMAQGNVSGPKSKAETAPQVRETLPVKLVCPICSASAAVTEVAQLKTNTQLNNVIKQLQEAIRSPQACENCSEGSNQVCHLSLSFCNHQDSCGFGVRCMP